MSKIIKGPFAVLMTPFVNEKVDEKSFIEQVKRVNGTGVSGFVVNGSTAEFIQLSIEEQKNAYSLSVVTEFGIIIESIFSRT